MNQFTEALAGTAVMFAAAIVVAFIGGVFLFRMTFGLLRLRWGMVVTCLGTTTGMYLLTSRTTAAATMLPPMAGAVSAIVGCVLATLIVIAVAVRTALR